MRRLITRLARLGVVTLSLSATAGLAELAAAAEFRIQTSLYMGGAKDPASKNLTLFKDDVVYDYIESPQEVTMFDPRRGRFVLFDVERRLRTEIPTKDVARNLQELRVHLANQKDNPVAKFFQAPQFDTALAPETDELVLSSPLLTYRVTTLPVDDSAALMTYIRFANAYAQLNAVTKPGSMPPFPRMAMNEILKSRGVIPAKLEFTFSNPAKLAANKSVTLKSVHNVQWRLFADDNKQIAETGKHLVTFKLVPPKEYLQLTNEAPDQNQQAQRQPVGKKQR